MSLQYSLAHRTNRATALNTDIGANAVLTIYSGTAPANVAAALSGNTALSTHACGSSGFGTAANGVLTAAAIANATASATGTATFFRIATSGGTVVVQGTVAASGADLNIAGGPGITSGQTVSISSVSDTMAGA